MRTLPVQGLQDFIHTFGLDSGPRVLLLVPHSPSSPLLQHSPIQGSVPGPCQRVKPPRTSSLAFQLPKYFTTDLLRLSSALESFLNVYMKSRDQAIDTQFHHLSISGLPTQPNTVVRNLGLLVDSDICFDAHIRSITRTAFYHLRNIAKLRKMLSLRDAEKLIHAFITTRLDYCNALLSGCPSGSLNKLQLVQNAAARVLTNTKKFDHITPVLSSLHWLPVKSRIDYKILLLTYKALNGLAPDYLNNLLTTYNPPRLLRSQGAGYLLVPRVERSTAGCRAFSYRAPQLWNVRVSGSLSIFKSRLKTHLFSLA
ncbi:uncharacterized protein [Paramormyrops kingsleyae]|uniref:uncharacterized protein n=1 Tax=Paramormyrops kingsleyae TaxID=1676925 RepID=UPI003B96E0BE